MSPLYIGLSIALILLSLVFAALVLFKTKEAKLGGEILGASAEEEDDESGSYWSKNEGRSSSGRVKKVLKVIGAIYLLLALVLCLII